MNDFERFIANPKAIDQKLITITARNLLPIQEMANHLGFSNLIDMEFRLLRTRLVDPETPSVENERRNLINLGLSIGGHLRLLYERPKMSDQFQRGLALGQMVTRKIYIDGKDVTQLSAEGHVARHNVGISGDTLRLFEKGRRRDPEIDDLLEEIVENTDKVTVPLRGFVASGLKNEGMDELLVYSTQVGAVIGYTALGFEYHRRGFGWH